MNKEFNKSILINNIGYLLKQQEKKIGELETAVGVSAGYISRINKEGGTKPGVEFIVSVAQELNVSIDILLGVDLSALTPTERYLMAFLEKMDRDTMNDRLEWHKESADYLNNNIEIDMDGQCDNPLFDYIFCQQEEAEHKIEFAKPVFLSMSYGKDTEIAGNCYKLQMGKRTYLYLMYVCKRANSMSGSEAKEVWLFQYGKGTYSVCTTKDSAEIADAIERLYRTISENMKHPKISREIKNVIDSFMSDRMDAYDDQFNELPFS